MRRSIFALSTLFFIFSVFAFQNCGKLQTSQLRPTSSVKLGNGSEYYDKQLIIKMKDDNSQQSLYAWAQQNSLQNMNSDNDSNEVIWDSQHMSHWKWEEPVTPAEMAQLLKQSSFGNDIEYAEPNYIFYPSVAKDLDIIPLSQQVLTTASPYFEKLAELESQLMPLESSTSRPIVAVIDSGIDLSHEAFIKTDAIWKNLGETGTDSLGRDKRTNGVDDDGNGYADDVSGYNFRDRNNILDDSSGHGTHCAGTVLGIGQNIFNLDVDVTTNPELRSKIRIMPLKFIGSNGGATSDAINAVFYAVRNGARVLSNSWGGPTYSRALESVIAYSYDNEAVFVAAAGNDGRSNDATPVYPSNYSFPNLLSVAANDNGDKLAFFSNFGAKTVDIGAPGSFILSTFPKPVGGVQSNYYEYLSGTSMATPMVAGTAALMFYENKLLKAHQIKNLLVENGDNLSTLTGLLKAPMRLNPAASVAQAKLTAPADSKPSRSLASVSSESNEPSAGKGAGCGLVKAISDQAGPRPPNSSPWLFVMLLVIPFVFAMSLRRSPNII
jgi:thermitase